MSRDRTSGSVVVGRETRIVAKDVHSLCWHGETLVDWVGGIACYHLDGHIEPPRASYSYVFDAAVASPSGEYVVIYTRLGTKGLVLRQGKVLREINRSFYYADAYEYPIALFRLRSGQEVIAHCPDECNRLEIDDLATGMRLTNTEKRCPCDFFFSRLAADDSCSFLLSAGWRWHPVDHVKVFDIEEAMRNPLHLDRDGLELETIAAYSSACFGHEGRLIVWLMSDHDDAIPGAEDTVRERHPFGVLRTFDLRQKRLISSIYPQAEPGTIAPLGGHHILGFHEHPKVIDLGTGAVVAEWPHLRTGKQASSIIRHIEAIPPFAVDSKHLRFAVADQEGIVVVQCELCGFAPSPETRDYVAGLVEREKAGTLSSKERAELDHNMELERLMRLAKAKALQAGPDE